jgi:hypothetical protein
MPYIREDVKEVHGKSTICLCPLCGKNHKALVDWQGRGICRKYCQPCLHNIGHLDGGLDDGSEFHKRAISVGR